MADISDVQNALVTFINNVIYPNGTGQASANNAQTVIYAGWPTSSRLDADLAAGKVHVTVFPRPEQRNTSRYSKDFTTLSIPAATCTMSAGNTTITLSGSITDGQVIAAIVNGKAYAYALQASDTLATAATQLAALINADTAATASGAVITINAAYSITCRTSTAGTSIKEIRRQEQVYQIAVWANTPFLRDTTAALIDVALAGVNFISLPDTSPARVVFKNALQVDSLQKEALYQRSLFYTVEYATTVTEVDMTVALLDMNISPQTDGAPVSDPTVTIYS